MRNNYNSAWIMALLCAGILHSCMDAEEYDFDKLARVKWNPEYAIPLVHGSLGINHLLNEEDSAALLEYEDGLFYLVYEDQLESRDLNNMVAIPDKSKTKIYQTPLIATVPANSSEVVYDETEELDLEITPEQLYNADIKSGSFDYDIYTTIAAGSNIEIVFSTVTDADGQPLTIVANLSENQQSASGTIDLSGYTMDFTTLDPAYNKLPYQFKATVTTGDDPVTLLPTDVYSLDIGFTGIQYSYMEGYFGKQVVDIPGDAVEIGSFGSFFDDGDFTLDEVKINLEVVNEYGVIGEVTFETFEARKDGQTLQVNTDPANPVPVAAAPDKNSVSSTNVRVVNSVELFNFRPEEFYYKASAEINPADETTANHMADTSNFLVNFRAEVPLQGSVQNISLKDTLDLSLEDISESEVETALLKLRIVNGFPIDAHVQIHMTDENYAVTDALFSEDQTHIVKGGQVDSNGNVTAAGEFDDDIEIDGAKFQNLMKASYLILDAQLSTTRDGASYPSVKFKSDQKIDINLGIQTKLDLSLTP